MSKGLKNDGSVERGLGQEALHLYVRGSSDVDVYQGFDKVTAFAGTGNDRAHFTDSELAEVVRIRPWRADVNEIGNSVDLLYESLSFEVTKGYSSSGGDRRDVAGAAADLLAWEGLWDEI